MLSQVTFSQRAHNLYNIWYPHLSPCQVQVLQTHHTPYRTTNRKGIKLTGTRLIGVIHFLPDLQLVSDHRLKAD